MAIPAQTVSVDDDAAGPPGSERGPHLFLALECDRPLAGPARFGLAGVQAVRLGRGERRQVEQRGAELVISVPDSRMSSAHARLLRSECDWLLEDGGSKNGCWVDGARVREQLLADGAVIELGHTLLRFAAELPLVPGAAAFADASSLSPSAAGLATLMPSLAAELRRLELIAASAVPVMLLGETGTGKDVLASAVHRLSGRRGPLVPVNCAALPQSLVESELFGHRKGAFSGAEEDRPGLVRAADRGTLLLDEIADLPLASQGALLRVLDDGLVLPVGGTEPIKVDARVIAATAADLPARVAQGRFRADLCARLAGFTLTLPPLRERLPDLGLCLASLLRRLAPEEAERVTFTPEAARALLAHGWPLNIRELERCLAAALVLARGARIGLGHLPPEVQGALGGRRLQQAPLTPEDERRRAELVGLLKSHGGNVSEVARLLGKGRMQIHRWAERYGLDLASFRR